MIVRRFPKQKKTTMIIYSRNPFVYQQTYRSNDDQQKRIDCCTVQQWMTMKNYIS